MRKHPKIKGQLQHGIPFFSILGALTGFINGLFGSGGGMLAVPMLRNAGLSTRSCHATALVITFPLSVASCIFYMLHGQADIQTVLPCLPFGLLGSWLGGWLMPRMSVIWLRRIFAMMLLFAGIRGFCS